MFQLPRRLIDPVVMQQLNWRVKLVNVGKAPLKKRFPQVLVFAYLLQNFRTLSPIVAIFVKFRQLLLFNLCMLLFNLCMLLHFDLTPPSRSPRSTRS
jgi:hypothetical protein